MLFWEIDHRKSISTVLEHPAALDVLLVSVG
jgi:hypothetical protein